MVLVRGHQANSWHLRPWRHLADRFDVVLLQTRANWFDTAAAEIQQLETRTVRDMLPPGRLGDMATRIPGDRYLSVKRRLAGADIVHSQDLVFWYSMQAAKYKRALGYKLVLTAWETIPMLDTYRNVRTRRYRALALRETDLFLAATERAKQALLLEGAPVERIRVCPPGVDADLFRGEHSSRRPREHVIVSAGRLVWHKGHQDVLRAVAALRRGIVPNAEAGPAAHARVLIIGAGPEEDRLRRHAGELGIADFVEIRSQVPYAEMPSVYAQASCLVLASLAEWFWEEQFGMVLAEAMASGLPIAAAASGAIPEVLRGQAPTFAPGDWPGLASILAEGPLARPPGERESYDPALVEEYSGTAYADRLARAYEDVLASR